MTFYFQTSTVSHEKTKNHSKYGITQSSVSKGNFQKDLILRQH